LGVIDLVGGLGAIEIGSEFGYLILREVGSVLDIALLVVLKD